MRLLTLYTIGDTLRIQQIIVNLLNNGLQATPSGQTAKFDIELRAEEDNLFIDVQDYGTGISEVDQSKIFERFYRGEIKKRRNRGLGLGLTYSRLLANAQNGELSLASSTPDGSKFTLRLPRWKTPKHVTKEQTYPSPVKA
ncbi:sensor histidine kinase [Bacillales bacterium AN1005]